MSGTEQVRPGGRARVESEVRPRVLLLAPQEPAAAARLGRALAGELAGAGVDVVFVGAAAEAPLAAGPEKLGEAVIAGRGRCRLALEGGLEAARALVVEGRVDGLVLAGPPPGEPAALRLRDGLAVVDPLPGVAARDLLARLSAPALAGAAASAWRVLAALHGGRPPRLALLGLPGEEALLGEAVALAREQGVDAAGPVAEADVARERALLGLTPAQVRLPLALLGAGPVTSLALEDPAPVAWSEASDPAAVGAALRRLGDLLRAGGDLVAAREAAARPTVSVAARRGGSAATSAIADRCPYCHRLLDEVTPDDVGTPGAPVACARCGTRHHRDCVAEHGRCTVLGCEGTSVVRLGVAVPIARLGPEDPRMVAFHPLHGDAGSGPLWLRLEAPFDDPEVRPRVAGVALVVPERARRGEVVEGTIVVSAPRDLRVRGGLLALRAELTTRLRRDDRGPRTQAIVAREAPFAGEAPASTLGRLQDGVVALFGGGGGVSVPAGVRRYPFSFRLPAEHPATVENRLADVEERVATRLEVALDTWSARASVLVT